MLETARLFVVSVDRKRREQVNQTGRAVNRGSRKVISKMFGQFIRGPLFEENKGGEGEGAGGGVPAFDAAKFQKDLMASVNQTINGALAKFKKENAPANGGGNGETDEERNAREERERGNQGADKTDPKLAKLQRDFEKLTKQYDEERKGREAAETKQKEDKRRGEIRAKLGEYDYVKKSGAESAFKALQNDISYNDEGELVGPNGEPFAEYIESQMSDTLDTLLAPREKGGSGAKRGSAAGKDEVLIEDIKPGMSKDAIEKARKRIADLAGEQMGRRW